MNFILGKYIAFAVNKPKGYPSKPYLSVEHEEKKTNEVQTVDEMERILRHNTIKLGGTINNGAKS